MADNGTLAGDSGERGSFSQLLFSSNDHVLGLDSDGCFNYASSVSTSNPQKMLCFADYHWTKNKVFPQKSGLTCSDSSSASSTNNTIINTTNPSLLYKSKKKRNGRVSESVFGAGVPAGNQGNGKKTKSEKTTGAGGHAKGKKESIGERIAALQQLVSPFGKTDTASVLHEAMGYIRFLQEQVQVLCSPYLQPLLLLHHEGEEGGENREAEKSEKDLRSKGLCLVPVESTLHVANNNGADFWLPAMKTSTISSSDH